MTIKNNKIITPNVVLDLNHVVTLNVLQGNGKTAIEVRLRDYRLEVFTEQAAEDIVDALKLMSDAEHATSLPSATLHPEAV